MGNPCNPLEWIRSAQDWLSRTERQSGFRPFLLFVLLVDGMGLTLLTLFKDIVTRYVALGTIALSTLSFIILYFIKAFTDPNFCRSETQHRKREQPRLETILHEHIERWKSETMHWSSMTRRIAHPSYLRIIALANSFTNHVVERTLLQELQKKPTHWFAALAAITNENPVRPEHTFDEAVAAWLAWGRERGII